MRIGSRQAPQQQEQYSRASATAADFGAGVATALGTLGRAISERGEANVQLEVQERERVQRTRNAANELELVRFEGESRRRLAESRAQQEAGAIGYTDEVNEMLETSFNGFADRLELDPEERQRFATRFETFRQSAVTSAYAFEFEQTNNKLISAIGQSTQEIQEELRTNPLAFENRQADLFQIIDDSALPPMVKDELKQNTYTALASTAYMAETQAAMQNMAPAQDPETAHGDVVAPGASAIVRGFAAATASVESAGPGNPYTRLYGGGSFSDYSDHPRQFMTITSGPNAGKKSSAAGKYQFLAGTWDFVRRGMEAEGYDFGAQPFSPVNQDRAFWWYAQHRYRREARRTGLTGPMAELSTALESGTLQDYERTRRMLSGESGGGVVWEGLQHLNAQQFMSRVRGGMERGALGSAEMPDAWNDSRYAGLSFEVKMDLDTAASEAELARMRAIADARKEQETQFMDQVRQMFAAGQGEQAYALGLQGMQDGRVTDIQNIERIQREGSEYREAFQSAQETQGRRASGMVALGSEDGALNAEARDRGITAGIRERDEQAASVMQDNFRRDGRLPSDISEALFAQLDSGDTQQQLFAMEQMAALHNINPRSATQGMSREQAEQMALASTLARFSGSPAEFLQRYNRLRDPANAAMHRTRVEEADKLFEDLGSTTIFREMYGIFARNLGAGVEAPSPGAMPAFDRDARTLFREYYALFGDKGQAQTAAAEVLKHSYTPSPFNSRIMEYSPTAPIMGVPQIGGSHEWIPGHVQQAVDTFVLDYAADLTQKLQAAGVTDASERAMQSVDQLYAISNMDVVADSETLADLQAGRPPSYLVSYTDALGQPMVLMDQNNQPVRIPLEPPQDLIRAVEVKNRLTNAQARESNIDFEIGRLEWSLRAAGGDMAPIPQQDGSQARMTEPERRARLEELQAQRTQTQRDSFREELSQMSPRELVAFRNQLRPPADYSQQDPYGQLAPPPQRSETERALLELIDEYLREAAR